MPITERLVARLLAAAVIGITIGCIMGASFVRDTQRGRSLTMKEYVADFQRYKADLEQSPPFIGGIVACVVMAFGLFSVYEGLRVVLEKVLTRLTRGSAAGDRPAALRQL